MAAVNHHTVSIGDHTIFYREAGIGNPHTVLLLHGAPASSFMFRNLIPLLAERYHVIAPDYLGFGLSDSPTVDEFNYTFDALEEIVAELIVELDVAQFAIYVQDYGAPIGWRLALDMPERIAAIITQNGNAYEEGFFPDHWAPLWAYSRTPNTDTEAPLRAALNEDAIRWQYLHGVRDVTLVSPDTWKHDVDVLRRPGNIEVQLKLFREYPTNVDLYPQVQQYFRAGQAPTLIVWGEHDEIFSPDGARAFLRDLPAAELHLLDGGHFLLESNLDEVAGLVLDFLHWVWTPRSAIR